MELYIVASEKVNKEVEQELKEEDPPTEIAIARLKRACIDSGEHDELPSPPI